MPLQKRIALGIFASVFIACFAWWIVPHSRIENNPPVAVPSTASPPAATMANGNTTAKVDSIDVLAERLQARLAKQPDDVDGWVLLARSYHYLERWDDAKAAFAKARSLGYRGAAGDTAGAEVATTAVDPVFEAVGRSQRQAAQIQAGDTAANIESDSAKNSPSETESPTAAGAAVQVSVGIDPALSARTSADTAVFIFARAATGPRMPLAAVRKTLRDLPIDIRLDDSLAMLPSAKLSGAQTIVIGARLSRSGNPLAQPGDIEVLSKPLSDWRGQRVQLLLNGKL